MDEVQRARALLEQIRTERKGGVAFGRAITYSVLGMFLIFFIAIYVRVKTFDGDLFVVELQRHAATTLAPIAQRELVTLEKAAIPAITNALKDETSDLIPRISDKLQSESVVFQENVTKQLQASLESHFMAQMAANKDVLASQTAAFSKDSALYDDLIRRLEVTSRLWAQETLDNVFYEHIIVLQSINQSVKQLQVSARKDVNAGKQTDPDDVILLLVDILNSRMKE